MNLLQSLKNTVRSLETMFPGYFTGYKHNHYADFGFPVKVTQKMLAGMYERNGIARGAVDKTVQKTWQDSPAFTENPEAEETKVEADIRKRLARINFWRGAAECDRRALVGGFSVMILRFADSRPLSEPVGRLAGLQGLVGVIPAWGDEISVSRWNTDPMSPDYGLPEMFTFNEQPVGEITKPVRKVDIHPSRVVIWSEDGTLDCQSALLPGYNDLMSIEKVIGAAAEGFWKNAKQSPIFEMDAEVSLPAMAQEMGVTQDELHTALTDQVQEFTRGFDPALILKGMKPTFPNINLASPEQHFLVALQSFAASMAIPLKILVGSQTGERASTEDARDWAQTNMARRENIVKPALISVSERLVAARVLPEKDWEVRWTDLTEETPQQRVDRAAKMAEIHAKFTGTGERVYLPEEIREVTGHEPLDEADMELDQNEPEPGPGERPGDDQQGDDPA